MRPEAQGHFQGLRRLSGDGDGAAGEVLMGSSRNDIDSGIAAANEGPQHKAIIRQPFAVGRFEVTRDQYAAFVKRPATRAATAASPSKTTCRRNATIVPSSIPGFVQDGNHPAVCVSWTDAQGLCRMAVADHRQTLPAAFRSRIRICRARGQHVALRRQQRSRRDLQIRQWRRPIGKDGGPARRCALHELPGRLSRSRRRSAPSRPTRSVSTT